MDRQEPRLSTVSRASDVKTRLQMDAAMADVEYERSHLLGYCNHEYPGPREVGHVRWWEESICSRHESGRMDHS